MLTTGASDNTNILNIFDLAGNLYEITLECSNNSEQPIVLRGGAFNNTGEYGPIAFRGYSSLSYGNNISFRATLYDT